MNLPLTTLAQSGAQGAASGGTCGSGTSFFSFPTWYQYLQCQDGQVVFPRVGGGAANSNAAVDIFSAMPLVGLAVLDILLRIAGMVAVFYIVYGGVSYVLSQGEPDKAAKSRGTIINALVGMTITIFAAAIVRFLGNRLGGGAG